MNPTDYSNGFTRPLGEGQDPESAPDGPDIEAVKPVRRKVRSGYGPGRRVQLPIDPEEVTQIELSITDASLDDRLATVGEQLLCLCPVSELSNLVGFEIPGRNTYAVKYAAAFVQSYWPHAHEFALVIATDTVDPANIILPPEYVQMIDPIPLVRFDVLAGI